jgi:hypothetical protein
MNDAALQDAAARCGVFARLTLFDKASIVRALRARGHVAGFMGDGINDAPALRAADVGIPVGTAVDIAREAADIILLEKSVLVLDERVLEGHTTFCNMLNYIRMTSSSSFGNVLPCWLTARRCRSCRCCRCNCSCKTCSTTPPRPAFRSTAPIPTWCERCWHGAHTPSAASCCVSGPSVRYSTWPPSP